MNKTPKKSSKIKEGIFFDTLKKKFLMERDVTEKKMFGTTALTNKGKVFAFPWKGNLVVKLPKERVAEIVASKKGIYFDPGHGRTSKEWVNVYATAQKQWFGFARAAKEYIISNNTARKNFRRPSEGAEPSRKTFFSF